jgi:hypothetical protein
VGGPPAYAAQAHGTPRADLRLATARSEGERTDRRSAEAARAATTKRGAKDARRASAEQEGSRSGPSPLRPGRLEKAREAAQPLQAMAGHKISLALAEQLELRPRPAREPKPHKWSNIGAARTEAGPVGEAECVEQD